MDHWTCWSAVQRATTVLQLPPRHLLIQISIWLFQEIFPKTIEWSLTKNIFYWFNYILLQHLEYNLMCKLSIIYYWTIERENNTGTIGHNVVWPNSCVPGFQENAKKITSICRIIWCQEMDRWTFQKLQNMRKHDIGNEWYEMVFSATILHYRAILCIGPVGLMWWILVWTMPQVQGWSLDLLICSPGCHHCAANQ